MEMSKIITSKNSKMAYVSPHSSSTVKSKTLWLMDLGSQYKVERTEDWDNYLMFTFHLNIQMN